MVRDTRSGRHFKDELGSSNLKKTPSNGRDLSPHCSQKSKFLEKGTPPLTPTVKRKSEGPEKQRTPTPVRMSDRTNKNASSSSSVSQKSCKELGLFGQREKENCDQAMMESKKTNLDVDSHFTKGNKMSARTFKGLFKRQRVMENALDVHAALDEPNSSSHVCADNPAGNDVIDSEKSFSASEKLAGNLLSISKDAPVPECSTSLETNQVVSTNSESDEQFTGTIVVENIPSPSTESENQGLLGTCLICSKIKRVNSDSPRQELCSCSDVVNEITGCSSSTREERLSRSVSIKSTSEASRFLEYWVPSQISKLQLELYCSTLLSNSIPLRSSSRLDSVGALQDILLNVRKCCDHPYLVDSSLQERMLAEKCAAAEVLDVGIKASGKLQLLDVMLSESRTRGLKTLILHQSIRRPGGASIGDILDDFLRQKYGPNTYERVDARVTLGKRQAAVNRFNKKETGQFAFLLENRACSSAFKLLDVDIIVLYDSDLNPANDIKTLQKISVDSKADQMKVFRLYSSCTVEERTLVLAKKILKLDNNLQTVNRTTSNSLLMWGASYLFNQLDDYHAYSNSTAFIISSGKSVLNEKVIQEFQAILSESYKNAGLSVISEVQLSAENYSMNVPLLGEAKNQLKDGEEPCIFWKHLLDRKDPHWRHIKGSCPRNRKRVQYANESPDAVNDNAAKRHKRVLHENSNPSSVHFELGEHQVTQSGCSKGGGSSTIYACDQSKSFWTESVTSDSCPNRKYGQSSHAPEVPVGDPENKGVLFDEQKNLYGSLEGETIKLCQILQLSEFVMDMVRRFLKYVIKNHQVSTDSPAYVQALQLSLCWIAASILKQKVDKKDSLMSAKELLDYQCTEEQVTSVYSRLRTLKRIYMHSSENFVESSNLLVEEGISMEPSNVDEAHAEGPVPMQEKMAMEDKVAGSEIERKDKNEVAPSATSSSAPFEAVCRNAPTETVSDEIQPVVMNEGVPKVVLDCVPNRVVDCFTPLKLVDIPEEEFDDVEAVGLVDAVENPTNRPDGVNIGALPAPEEPLVCSVAASPNCYGLLPQQVPGEQNQSLVSARLQLENQSCSNVEVSTSQILHVVNNPLLSHHGELETGNQQLHSVSVDATLVSNQLPTFEVEHQNQSQGSSSVPTSEAGKGTVLLHDPSSESRENSQVHSNHINPCPGARFQELPNHDALHLGINAGHLNGPSHLHAHSTHQVATCNSTPDLSDDPLQIELERMQKASEELEKSQEDVISQLKSKCEMEIQEIITKIRNDYDMKLKNTEAEYMLKKNELGKNQALVLMNKILAEALRSKCLDHRPFGLRGMQQGDSESLRQHLQPAPTSHSTTPDTRPSPIANLTSMVPPVQRSPALFSSTPSRPPLIGAITPSVNPHTGRENRAMAPHLQASRPPAASCGSLVIPQPPPALALNSRSPPLLAQQMQANLASQVRPGPQVALPTSNVDLSTVELPSAANDLAPAMPLNDMLPYLDLPTSACLSDE